MSNLEVIHPIDLPEALEVMNILSRHYQAPVMPMGGSWNLNLVEQELRVGRGRGLWVGGRLCAFILYRESEYELEISVLATHPHEQRKGYMERLLREFLAGARERRQEVWLEVHEANLGAQKLYEKLGFKRVGQRPFYYSDGGTAQIYMWR